GPSAYAEGLKAARDGRRGHDDGAPPRIAHPCHLVGKTPQVGVVDGAFGRGERGGAYLDDQAPPAPRTGPSRRMRSRRHRSSSSNASAADRPDSNANARPKMRIS